MSSAARSAVASNRSFEAGAACGVAAAVFVAYVATLQPSVPGGDAGELIAASWVGGVAHPPGYPLFTLLARAFTCIPLGSPAWRVNLLSAVCDAAAAGFVSAIVTRWTARWWAGVLAAGLFASSPLVWSYATGAEVFALNNLFVAGLVYLALRWDESRDPRWVVLGAFVFGLGMSNHHTLSLFGMPLAVWVILTGRGRLHARVLLLSALSFLAGLVPYAYLPIAAAHHPSITWGDPTTMRGFLQHGLRSEYGTLRLGGELPAGSQFFPQVALYARALARESIWAGLPLAAIGCLTALLARRGGSKRNEDRRGFALALATCFAVYIVVFHYAANLPVRGALYREVTARFWQQPNLVAFVWIGVGFVAVRDRFRKAPVWAFAAVALAAPLLSLLLGFPGRNESGNRFVTRYAEALLAPLPEGAILLTRGDLVTNSVRYLQACEGARPDVAVLDQELLTRPWYVAAERRKHPDLVFPGTHYDPLAAGAFSIAAWLDANRGARAVWVYPELNPNDRSWLGRFEVWPSGLPARVVAAGDGFEFEAWRRAGAVALEELGAVSWPRADRYPEGSWEHVVLLDVLQASNRRAAWLLSRPSPWMFDPEVLGEARGLLEKELAAHPSPPPYLYKNLGIVYERLRQRDPTLLVRRDEAWREFLRTAPAGEPDRAAIEAALRNSTR